ncbi:protein LTO1 homolog [Stigmatopora nigra]
MTSEATPLRGKPTLAKMASEHDNDNVDDIFDCIVMAEESFRGQGYRDGFETGSSRGLLTGRTHGASHGARLSTEMAFYHGFAVTWKSLLERRPEAKGRKRQLKALDALLGSIPASGMEEPQSEKLKEEMEKLRSKFRQACSVLGVQTDFSKRSGATTSAEGF